MNRNEQEFCGPRQRSSVCRVLMSLIGLEPYWSQDDPLGQARAYALDQEILNDRGRLLFEAIEALWALEGGPEFGRLFSTLGDRERFVLGWSLVALSTEPSSLTVWADLLKQSESAFSERAQEP